MNRKQRIIWDDNGTLKDISRSLNDFRSSASVVVGFEAANDAIYVGTELPFNTRYLKLGTANDLASAVSISVWDGNAWIPTKDVIDETKTSFSAAISLAQSGQISFALDRDDRGWGSEQDSNDIPDLAGTFIYDLFWTKWTWSADWKNTTSLSYVGSLYSTDNDLSTFYPDLMNIDLMDAFETGKTTWLEQGFSAAEAIERELRSKSIIMRREQLFDWSLLLEASVHKTAEIIYGGLGSAYNEAKKLAAESYIKSINLKYFETDRNGDGVLSPVEQRHSQTFFTR
jgi:hypothetical protein